MFHWAREYSTALVEGGEFIDLPQVIIISILDFRLFDCEEFESEFKAMEVTRHTLLTDRMDLKFFELPKLPEGLSADDRLQLWLKLFAAETEEELIEIEAMEVPEMKKAINAYRHITATDEFRALERMRADARRNEAAALGNARREERALWEGVVADKDAALADKDAEIERLRALLEEKTKGHI